MRTMPQITLNLVRLTGGYPLVRFRKTSRPKKENRRSRRFSHAAFGAGNRNRTYDPIITNDVLYQLSYSGVPNSIPASQNWGKLC